LEKQIFVDHLAPMQSVTWIIAAIVDHAPRVKEIATMAVNVKAD
jgi:hypothetical protein